MHRFLSELWSTSECPIQPGKNRPGTGSGSFSRETSANTPPICIRSLASRLVCPSDSDSDVDEPACKKARGETVDSTSHVILPVHSQWPQPQHGPERQFSGAAMCGVPRHTACKSRASPRVHVRGRIRSPALPCDRQVAHRHDGQTSVCLLPDGLRFGSMCLVGKRSYIIPKASSLDPCLLASFQVQELALLSCQNIRLRLLLERNARYFSAIWTHCVRQVEGLIHDFGDQVCVFKIGISSNVAYRMAKYKESNFVEMRLIHCSDDAQLIAVLEVLLVAQFKEMSGCRNVAKGGDGSMVARDP